MAAREAMNAWEKEAVLEEAQRSARDGSVPVIHYVVGDPSDGSNTIAVCYLVYVRLGGFMLAIPNSEEVQTSIAQLADLGEGEPAFTTSEVEVESSRQRALGSATVGLVDLPWELVGYFSKPAASRNALPRGVQVIQLKVNRSIARPVRASLLEAADAWIGSAVMEADTAQEYLTGEEWLDSPDNAQDQPDPPSAPDGTASPAVVQNLLARIAELEAQLKTPVVSSVGVPPRQPGPGPTKASPLVPLDQGQTLSAQEWDRIKKLAGAPPPRVGSAEQRRATVTDQTGLMDQALALQEKEAEEDPVGSDAFVALVAASKDPLQQMLAMQLQNQMLLKKLVPKQTDPVLGALSGSGSDSASGGGSNVKGCLAREAYLKAVNDLPKVAAVARANALKELGYTSDRDDGALMKRYVERRIPLAEFRQLALMATMLAEAWQVGHASQNFELLGIVARMWIMTDS